MKSRSCIRDANGAYTDYLVLLGMAGAFLAALFFRVQAISFGLPDYPHPDEAKYLPKAIAILKSGSPNPHYFYNPPLFTYLLTILTKLVYEISQLSGAEQTFDDFISYKKTSLLVYSRILVAVFGAATAVVVYQAGLRLRDSFTGIAAALFIALCFLHARDSHYAVNDVLMTFFLSCSFLGCIGVWRGTGINAYLWTGLFIGLAVATKFNAGIAITPLITAHILRSKSPAADVRFHLLIALLVALMVFTIVCPWYLLETGEFFKGFFNQLRLGKTPWPGQSEEAPVVFYFKSLLWGYGWIPMLMAVVGIISVIRRSIPQTIVLLSFPIVYICSMSFSDLFFVRFVMPILPFLALFSGIGLSEVSKQIRKRLRYLFSLTITAIVIILTFLQGFVFIVQHNNLISLQDSRYAANLWINKYIQKNSEVLYTRFTPKFDKYNFRETRLGKSWRVGDLEKFKGAYVVISSYYRCRSLLYPQRYPNSSETFQHIENHGTLIYESSNQDFTTRCFKEFALDNIYSPFWNLFSLKTPGPEIKVYRLRF